MTLSAGTLATLLTDNAMSSAVSPLLVAQAAKVALIGTASGSITTLTEGVLQAMYVNKVKVTLAAVLMLVALGGAGVYAYYLRAQEPPAKRENPAQPPGKKAADKAPEKKPKICRR